jgi:phosphopantothenoylcysteine decarboxylase/phosphopantothenate--cysteine ligase
MHDVALARAGQAKIYIGAAAVSDYRPAHVPAQKIKKKADTLDLALVKCPDVLAAIAVLPGGPFTVGFAAETEKLEAYALEKMEKKALDMIVANRVGTNIGFDRDDNSAIVLWPGGRREIGHTSKTELARQLVSLVAERYRAATPTPIRRPRAS